MNQANNAAFFIDCNQASTNVDDIFRLGKRILINIWDVVTVQFWLVQFQCSSGGKGMLELYLAQRSHGQGDPSQGLGGQLLPFWSFAVDSLHGLSVSLC
jgi:hypothetical protein